MRSAFQICAALLLASSVPLPNSAQSPPGMELFITDSVQEGPDGTSYIYTGQLRNLAAANLPISNIGLDVRTIPAGQTNVLLTLHPAFFQSLTTNFVVPATGYSGPMLKLEVPGSGVGPVTILASLRLTAGRERSEAAPAEQPLRSPLYLNLPKLRVSRQDGMVRVSWPVAPAGFTVQSTTNVATLSDWQAVGNTPLLEGEEHVFTDQVSAPQTFYRLRAEE